MKGVTTKTPERVAEAQRMRAEGMLLREIGAHFGIAKETARSWIYDPDGSELRARKRKYDLACVECGGRVSGTDPSGMSNRDEPVCIKCTGEHYAIWTAEAIVLAIQEWADEHGGIPPTANDWQRARAQNDARVTSITNVQWRFGSWNAAIRTAGFEPHAGGPVGGITPLTPEQREECARRYAAGESSVQIAADFQCSPATVLKWVRKAGVSTREPFYRKAAA